ncbi:Protein of unknown function [Leuconostoc citreum LBAE C11]|nr:Protein of unknown function [Leuconostoc citreum LBAE C11]
MLPTEFIA